MRSEDRGFTYGDLLECIAVLRTRAYGKFLAELISLVGYYVVDRDVKQMLSYLVRLGKVERRPAGKDTRYAVGGAGLSDPIVAAKVRKSRRRWRGTWRTLTYDVPTTHNAVRRGLVRRLRKMGFGELCASTWVSPYDWRATLDRALSDAACPGTFYHLESSSVELVPRRPDTGLTGVWVLEGVAAQYVQLARQCTKALAARGRSAARTRARTLVAARKQLRLIEAEDPMLPAELLPGDWPRLQAVEAMQALWGSVRREIYDQARLD